MSRSTFSRLLFALCFTLCALKFTKFIFFDFFFVLGSFPFIFVSFTEAENCCMVGIKRSCVKWEKLNENLNESVVSRYQAIIVNDRHSIDTREIRSEHKEHRLPRKRPHIHSPTWALEYQWKGCCVGLCCVSYAVVDTVARSKDTRARRALIDWMYVIVKSGEHQTTMIQTAISE